MNWSRHIRTSKTLTPLRPRPRGTVSCKAIRDRKTIANYQKLVHKLSQLNTDQLRKTIELEYTSSSIDFLTWLAEAPLENEADYSSLGARIMAIREGYNPAISQDSAKEGIEKAKSTEIEKAKSTEIEKAKSTEIEKAKSTEIEKAEILALDLDLKSSKARSLTAIIGRRKIDNSNDVTDQINSITDIPKRIIAYLLSLETEQKIDKGIQDAISETIDDHHHRSNEDIELLSASPIQLIAIVQQWQQQQSDKGYIEDLQSPVDLHKLEFIKSQILLHLSTSKSQ